MVTLGNADAVPENKGKVWVKVGRRRRRRPILAPRAAPPQAAGNQK